MEPISFQEQVSQLLGAYMQQDAEPEDRSVERFAEFLAGATDGG